MVRDGQRLHVLGAAYSPAEPTAHRQTAVVSAIYLPMGRALERMQVSAGPGPGLRLCVFDEVHCFVCVRTMCSDASSAR